MYRWLLLFVLVFGVVGWWYIYVQDGGTTIRQLFFGDYKIVRVNDVPLSVEVADTPAAREKGLSGQSGLDDSEALLMIFDTPDYYRIWMKDMRFPIDVIWIGEDFKVVDVVRSMQPDSYPQIFEPQSPAKYVLETKAFFTNIAGVNIGDPVIIPPNLLEH
jgi:uncharacterized membrane protein (UPF0127 family)